MIRIFRYLKLRDVLLLLLCVGLIVLEVYLELTMPDYTAKLTAAASSPTGINIDDVWANGGMMLLLAGGATLCALATGVLGAILSADFTRTIRDKLFDRISDFSDAEFNHFTTASLITRTTNDVVQVQILMAIGTQMLIKAPVLAIWAITKISLTSLEWTMAALITVIAIIVVLGTVVLIAMPHFRRIQKLTDELNKVTRENVSGIRVIRAFNAEEHQSAKFAMVNEEVTANNLFATRALAIMTPTLILAMNILVLSIYWIGAGLINAAPFAERSTVVGEMVGFSQYALQIVMSFIMLVAIFIFLPRTLVSAKRINEVLDTKPSIVFPTEPVRTTKVGEIEYKDVTFAYADAPAPCLQNLSFSIHQGETFAIIGATGTGKTTLINLLPRFYEVSEGSVELDGVDIRNFPLSQIQEKISFAPQKAILFKGTVEQNVTYGSDVDPEKLQECLRIAQCDFVSALEGGLQFEIAQGGSNLSGGQRQRLCIARALYKNAEVIVFDDAFSALDYKTDSLVRAGIREKLKGTTVIIVAQRIGTIKNADRILVLDEGKIVGLGTHKDLLEQCPVYKEIALSQLKEDEL